MEQKQTQLSLLWISEVLACLQPFSMTFLTYCLSQQKVQLPVSITLVASVSFPWLALITNLFGIPIHSKFNLAQQMVLHTLTFLLPLSPQTTKIWAHAWSLLSILMNLKKIHRQFFLAACSSSQSTLRFFSQVKMPLPLIFSRTWMPKAVWHFKAPSIQKELAVLMLQH